MPISEAVIAALVKATVDIASKRISSALEISDAETDWSSEKLASHLDFVSGWCQTFQILGMNSPRSIESGTIPLKFIDRRPNLDSMQPASFVPGRALSRAKDVRMAELENSQFDYTEKSLLTTWGNFLILGSPGAGKTTTVKRLCYHLLTSEAPVAVDGSPAYQYPILVRVRDISRPMPLAAVIADQIGIKYELKETLVGGVKEHLLESGGMPLLDAVAAVLDASQAVLFIDGLDEADGKLRAKLDGEIQKLLYMLKQSKVIVSLRKGDYDRTFENIIALEVRPLDWDGITLICNCWLGDGSVFIKMLKEKPYHDLANRPLFITQLLLIYLAEQDLPSSAILVYERVVRLSIELWAKDQGILRRSKYGSFGVDAKLRFLASMAYQLTYRHKAKVFERRMIQDSYERVRRRFRLPAAEAEEVLRELEAHTGLLLRSSLEAVEFSHLSLQEFLCAEYITREPSNKALADYFEINPAPVAVAVALSTAPEALFATLLLNFEPSGFPNPQRLRIFLDRLCYEAPYFSPTIDLGVALLRLLSEPAVFELGNLSLLEDLIEICQLWDSILMGLHAYRATKRDAESLYMSLIKREDVESNFPLTITIPIRFVTGAIRANGTHRLKWGARDDVLLPIEITKEGSLIFRECN
ncbi:NACHT domain-containing protein [Paraburkholderia strydomiana]|jgi:hypothetical protein|uniref:NACHT domain-containing protein n=1 Tax=Paraburkholderia strydomiana TaxID=1245417 RepID=UPI0038B995AB